MTITKQELTKLIAQISKLAKKDSDFPQASSLTSGTDFTVLQDGKNKRISLDKLIGFINNNVSAQSMFVDGKSVAEWISEFKDGLPEIPSDFEPIAENISYSNTTHENVPVSNCEQALNYLFRMIKNPNIFITLATNTEINNLFN